MFRSGLALVCTETLTSVKCELEYAPPPRDSPLWKGASERPLGKWNYRRNSQFISFSTNLPSIALQKEFSFRLFSQLFFGLCAIRFTFEEK